MKIGVVGLGYWGPNYIRSLLELSQEVTAFDIDKDRLEEVHRKFPAMEAAASWKAILDDCGIAAVIIATPLKTHSQLIFQAVSAGKHILVEKAMCYSVDEAEEIVKRVDGQVLMVGHITCFSPGIKKVKSLLDQKIAGEIRSMSFFRTHMGPIYPEVDVLREVGCHDVSIALWLKGEMPISVTATGLDFLGEGNIDYGNIIIRWRDGALANITTGWCFVDRRREFIIAGNSGSIRYNCGAAGETVEYIDTKEDLQRLQDQRNSKYSNKVVKSIAHPLDSGEPLKAQIKEFIACIEGKNKPLTDAKFGCDVVKVVCAAYESARESAGFSRRFKQL